MKNVTKIYLAFVSGVVLSALTAVIILPTSHAKPVEEDLMTFRECSDVAAEVDPINQQSTWSPTNKLYERKGICRVDYKGQRLTANEARRQWAAENLQGFGEE